MLALFAVGNRKFKNWDQLHDYFNNGVEDRKTARLASFFYQENDTLFVARTGAVVLETDEEIRTKLLEIHERGHFGVNHVEAVARECYFFNNFRKKVKETVSHCDWQITLTLTLTPNN